MAATRTKTKRVKINRVTKPGICYLGDTGFITRVYFIDKGQYARYPFNATADNLIRGPGILYYTTPDRETERTPPEKVKRCVPHVELQPFDNTVLWRMITSLLREKSKDVIQVFGPGTWETVPPPVVLPEKYQVGFAIEKPEFHLLATALCFYYGYSTTDSLDLIGHYVRTDEMANEYINRKFTVADLAQRIVINEYEGEENTRLRA